MTSEIIVPKVKMDMASEIETNPVTKETDEAIEQQELAVQTEAPEAIHEEAIHEDTIHEDTIHEDTIHEDTIKEDQTEADMGSETDPEENLEEKLVAAIEELERNLEETIRQGQRQQPEEVIREIIKDEEIEEDLAEELVAELAEVPEEEPQEFPEQDPREGKVRATPSARRIAREFKVDIKKATGTGPNGRIEVDDVKKMVVIQPGTFNFKSKEPVVINTNLENLAGNPQNLFSLPVKLEEPPDKKADNRKKLKDMNQKIEKMPNPELDFMPFVDENAEKFEQKDADVVTKISELDFVPFVDIKAEPLREEIIVKPTPMHLLHEAEMEDTGLQNRKPRGLRRKTTVQDKNESEITEEKISMAEAIEPEAIEPEATEPEATEPEVTEPEVTEPEVVEPEVVEPEVTDPEATEPEVIGPEVSEPEVIEPEVSEPEVTEPEAAGRETLAVETAELKTSEPESLEPETEPIQREVPEIEVPEIKVPETKVKEIENNEIETLPLESELFKEKLADHSATADKPAPVEEKSVKSNVETAVITLTTEIDMTEIKDLRKKITKKIEDQVRYRCTYTDFLLLATSRALIKHPLINARRDDDEIIIHTYVHMGLTVESDQDLIVPVIENTQDLDFVEMVKSRGDLLKAVKNGHLPTEQLQGSTFTITNLGMYGIREFTAIINQPNSAILSVGEVVQRIRVHQGEPVVRSVMKISLNLDRQVADGVEGAKFLQDIKADMENPSLLLF